MFMCTYIYNFIESKYFLVKYWNVCDIRSVRERQRRQQSEEEETVHAPVDVAANTRHPDIGELRALLHEVRYIVT